MVACALGGSLYRRRSCRTFLKQNIVQRTFRGLEPWIKKMGPNSELRSSSLKIRRKHFLSTIFRHLSANFSLLIQLARIVYSTNFISSWPKESIILATEKNTSYNSNVLVCGIL
ncbi:hypothetical protein TB1_004354 [Malus domestica]